MPERSREPLCKNGQDFQDSQYIHGFFSMTVYGTTQIDFYLKVSFIIKKNHILDMYFFC